jgi:hypothetical protein
MTAPFIKLLKVWLILLTMWLFFLTGGILLFLSADVSLYDPKAMFTRWSGNDLNIGNGPGNFIVTHLNDVNRHAFAELPKPLLVVSSGGVLIPHADLAKLTWIIPPDVYDTAFPLAADHVVPPPSVGAQIEALYLFPASARFRTNN